MLAAEPASPRAWIWIAGALFALIAGLIKALLYPWPEYNPPAIYPMVTAFAIAVTLWSRIVMRRGTVTVLSGVFVGAVVGLATPPVMWLVYGAFLSMTDPTVVGAFSWSVIYALLMVTRVSWLTALPGAVVGGMLTVMQRQFRQREGTAESKNAG